MRISDWSSDVCSSDLAIQTNAMATANKPMDVLIGNCPNIVTIVPQLSCRTPRTSRGARKFSATGKVRQLRRTDRFGRRQRHRCSPAEAVSESNRSEERRVGKDVDRTCESWGYT